jgi:uncharacterized protein YndB with AHSA1/START domain
VTTPAFVRLVEVFEAPRQRVFAAWTEPERLRAWWGPGRFRTTRADVDLRPGGRYELVLEPGPMRLVGEFREVVAPERLVYTWRWEAGVPDRRESLVTVEFRDLGPRTEVVLLHDSFAGPGPVDMYGAGWKRGLQKLHAHLGSEEAA